MQIRFNDYFIAHRESIGNGTTTPSSSNIHYDNPRFLCYDVPRSSIRSRQNSESMSTLGGSVAEIKNPVYAAKRRYDCAGTHYHHPHKYCGWQPYGSPRDYRLVASNLVTKNQISPLLISDKQRPAKISLFMLFSSSGGVVGFNYYSHSGNLVRHAARLRLGRLH
jgi:hypothetical protein